MGLPFTAKLEMLNILINSKKLVKILISITRDTKVIFTHKNQVILTQMQKSVQFLLKVETNIFKNMKTNTKQILKKSRIKKVKKMEKSG
jgi:hypothetical protein